MVPALGAAGAPLAVCGTAAVDGAPPPAGWAASLYPLASDHARGLGLLAGRTEAPPAATGGVEGPGRYCLEAPGPGVWKVVISAPGFVAMSRAPLALTEPVELPPVSLEPDAGIRVAVRDAAGDPAAGVWVLAKPAAASFWARRAADGWRAETRIARSGGDGGVTLPRAAGEALDLWAFAAGGLEAATARGTGAAAALELPASPPRRSIAVRGAAGEPLPGVVVTLAAHGWPAGVTGGDGTVELAGGVSGPVPLVLEGADGRRRAVELPAAPEGGDGARFELSPPAPVRGRVVAAGDRRALPRALVWLGPDAGRFAFTDARGEYAIVPGDREKFWLQAGATGFLPRSVAVGPADAAAGRVPTLALEAPATAAGVVVDEAGAPLPGAAVTATEADAAGRPAAFHPDRAAGRARSDARGRFELAALRPGADYELAATLEGFAAATLTLPVSPPPGEPPGGLPGAPGRRDLRLVLRPARAAFGQVVDRRDRPLPGIEVTLRAAGDRVATGRTGPDGRFRIAALPAPRFDLTARGAGFAPLTVPGVEPPPGRAPADLGTVVLEPGARLAGRVTDAGGEPLAGAEVRAREAAGLPADGQAERLREQPPGAVSDSGGRFVLEDLPPGRAVDLLTRRDGYLPAWTLGAAVPAEEPVTVVLEAAARLAGRVVDEAGEGIAGARVGLHRRRPPAGTVGVEPRRAGGPRSTTSGTDGGFEFEEVAPGGVQLIARAEDYLPGEPVELELPAGGERVGVHLVLERGAVVEGGIRDARGAPVAGAELRAGPAAERSDAEGRYRLGGVPPGLHALQAGHPDYRRLIREIEVEPGVNLVDLVLEDGCAVAGRALDERGAGLAGVRVDLRSASLRAPVSHGATTDGAGRFRIVVPEPGGYRLTAAKGGYAPAEIERLEVAAEGLDEVEVTLARGASAVGRVFGLALEDLAAVRVEARRDGDGAVAGAVDYRGRYAIDGLGPGDWELLAELAGGRRQARATVTVEAGARQVERDLEFAGVRLSGRIRYDGDPVAAAFVSLEGRTASGRRDVVSGHDGSFQLDDLEPGGYRLDILDPARALSHVEDLDLPADRHLEIELRAFPLTGRVSAEEDDRPLVDALVSIRKLVGGEPGPLTTVATDATGGFAVAHATPGRYLVGARKDGYSPAELAVEVEPGAPPEPALLRLARAGGLDLEVRLASGEVPAVVTVAVFDAAGRAVVTDTRGPTDAGFVTFEQIPAGTWRALVGAPGAAPSWIAAAVPGPEIAVTLAPGASLTVRVPALIANGAAATLGLTGGAGEPFVQLEPGDPIRSRWTLSRGLVTLAGVPAGVWTVRVDDLEGATWAGTAVTDGATPAVVTLE